ncbi:hypothetical protein PsYK624_140960 [Phanerochaete sordida]|uniref:F-box domain-containing protein n=1 Tax=Phanerochaete sordida TaxID=48140 RepID=A0A9P3GPB4_9APHY|nr:hypothetical protein PsYK624_140960 [Phanerochaete sordida]
MHPCLHIDEITRSIASHVEHRHTLVHLALVCRAFAEPATDELWSHLDGLKPLLMCLHSNLLGKSDTVYNALTILVPPTQDEWSRFRHYARKVKSLETHATYGGRLLDDAGYAILAEHHPDGVLPNLRHLKWHEWGGETPALPFMRPTLSTLAFVGGTVEALRAVMAHIRDNLPQLEEFTYSHDSWFSPIDILINDFSDTILALHHLTSFPNTSAFIRPDVVLHLSRLSHLTSLAVILENRNRDLWTQPLVGGFPALTHLTLTVLTKEEGLLPGVQMLQTLSGLALTNIKIKVSIRSVAIDHCTSLISELGRFRRLQECDIWGSSTIDDVEYFDASVFGPLHPLADIRTFTWPFLPVAFTQESAQQLSAAWPQLKEFYVCTPSDEPGPPPPVPGHRPGYMRLEDLLWLAQRSTRLEPGP